MSGFRRTNATGIHGERNIYFRLVFCLTVEELGVEAEAVAVSVGLRDSLATSEMFPQGETLSRT